MKEKKINVILFLAFIFIFYIISFTFSASFEKNVMKRFKKCCIDKIDNEKLKDLKCYFPSAVRIKEKVAFFGAKKRWWLLGMTKSLYPIMEDFSGELAPHHYPVYTAILFGDNLLIVSFREGDTSKAFVMNFNVSTTLNSYSYACQSNSRCDKNYYFFFKQLLELAKRNIFLVAPVKFYEITGDWYYLAYAFNMKQNRYSNIMYFGNDTNFESDQFTGSLKYQTVCAFNLPSSDGLQHYWTFQRNNIACPHWRTIENYSLEYDYELSIDSIAPHCYRTQVFFGCPQSFCFNHEIDDAFISYENEHAGPLIFLFRGIYYWELPLKNYPLKYPSVNDAKAISDEEFSFNSDQSFLYIDAAESIILNNNEYVITVKNLQVTIFENKKLISSKSIAETFSDISLYNVKTIDTIWHNVKRKELFLFFEEKFAIYNYNINKKSQKIKFSPKSKHNIYSINIELPGLTADLDAAFSNISVKKGYLLKRCWLYTIPEDNFSKEKYSPKNTFDPTVNFFNTKNEPCSIDDKQYEDFYEKDLYLRTFPIPAKYVKIEFNLDDSNYTTGFIVRESNRSIYLFIISGFVIAFASLLLIILILIAIKKQIKDQPTSDDDKDKS